MTVCEQGIEDYLGDMDFKLAGTAKGITALQVPTLPPGSGHKPNMCLKSVWMFVLASVSLSLTLVKQ